MCPKIVKWMRMKLSSKNIKHKWCAEKFRDPFKNFSVEHLNNAFHQPPSEFFDNSRPRPLYLSTLSKEQDERNNARITSMLVERAFDIVLHIQPFRSILDDT